jgi:N-methylhydantoinase A
LGIATVICPPAAGVASALGFLVAPFSVDLVRTHPARLGSIDWAQIAGLYAEMAAEAEDLLERSGVRTDIKLARRVDMRYAGQGYTVTVSLPDEDLDDRATEALRERFATAYERRFGSRLDTAEPEALHWRLTASVQTQSSELSFQFDRAGEARRGERETYFPEAGGFLTCPVYNRYALEPGQTIDGPALVQERESTVVVGPMAKAGNDELGNLLVTIEES